MSKLSLKIFYIIVFILGLFIIFLICLLENIINLWNESFFFSELKRRYIKQFKTIKNLLKANNE